MSEDLVLRHYGVKGMKWGVRKKSDGSSSRSSSSTTSDAPKKKINKKAVAVTVGVLAGAALVGVGAAAMHKHNAAGKSAVKKYYDDFAKQSVVDILSQPKAKAKVDRGRALTKGQAEKRIKDFANQSVVDILSKNQPSAYKSSSKKIDTKIYGTKAARKIEKQVNNGRWLSDARKSAAARKAAPIVGEMALNIGVAQAKERLRRGRGQNGNS